MLRWAVALLRAPESYLRALFVLVGAALVLALGVAVFTVLETVAEAGAPPWATELIGLVLAGAPLLAGLVPAVRQLEGAAAQTLLAAEFPAGPPGPAAGWQQRWRTLGWFLVHLLTGGLIAAAVVGLIGLAGSWWIAPAAAATVLATLVAGWLLARLGPVMLGPSPAERLQRLEADAVRAAERNQIAREIHDSVGHALSVVTVQASAARRLIGRDPAFAEQALETIEDASRRAAAELDHMLGVLRDELQRPAGGPVPGLDGLDELLGVARSSGLNIAAEVDGDLAGVPALVSQEAYRIVQEGLTNALKYSADRTAKLSLWLDQGALGIRLSNPAGQPLAASAGRGLHGIEERATTLGGSVQAGFQAGAQGGRWTLSVVLPAGQARP
jgi:signal transduction histidine kinase